MDELKTGHGLYQYNNGCKCQVYRDAKSRKNWSYRHPGEPWPGRPEEDAEAIDIIIEILCGAS